MHEHNLVSPVKIYANTDLSKKEILNENKNKSGIYCWKNNLNGKTYVGSAINLSKRINSYYNIIESNKKLRPILGHTSFASVTGTTFVVELALSKYGFENFTLEILEYCEKENVMVREQFFIDLLIPEYNVLKHAYSLLGFKHSELTISKLKQKVVSAEHKKILSSLHKNKKVSEETKLKLAAATKAYRKKNSLSAEALSVLRNKSIVRNGVKVNVLNTKTNEITSFTNQTQAAEFLGVTRQAIYIAIKRESLVKEIYKIIKCNK